MFWSETSYIESKIAIIFDHIQEPTFKGSLYAKSGLVNSARYIPGREASRYI